MSEHEITEECVCEKCGVLHGCNCEPAEKDTQKVMAELHQRIRQAMREYEEVDFEIEKRPIMVADIQHTHIKRIKEALKDAYEKIA